MSNIYLKVAIEKKLHVQNFDLQDQKARLQGSLNFQTSCYNFTKFEIRGLGAKLCVAFLLFLF